MTTSGCAPGVVLEVAGLLFEEAEKPIGIDDNGVGLYPSFSSGSSMQ